MDLDVMDEKGVNPWTDVLSEEKYRELFGYEKHVFTGVDYVDYYKNVIRECGAEVEIILPTIPKRSWTTQKAYSPAIFTAESAPSAS